MQRFSPETALSSDPVPNPIFEAQLDDAFAAYFRITLPRGVERALTSETIRGLEVQYSQLASFPDTHPYHLPALPLAESSSEVCTENPTDYSLLLMQAVRRMRLRSGDEDPGLVATETILEVDRHERAHGAMATQIGLKSRYGVRIERDPVAQVWGVGPYHQIVGPGTITKLDEAAILAAPDTPSQGDIAAIQALGYSGQEEVLEKFYAAHPELERPAEI